MYKQLTTRLDTSINISFISGVRCWFGSILLLCCVSSTAGQVINSLLWLTDHSDGADSRASASSILYADTIAAAVFSLGLADVEAEVVGGAVEADVLICLQVLIILCPGDSRGRFATVASRQHAVVSHLYHELFPEVQVQSRWLCRGNS